VASLSVEGLQIFLHKIYIRST